jgi:hypothetical protein
MKIITYSLIALSLFSCGKLESVLDKAESIPGKMDGLNANTKELERKEVVKTAVQELNDTKNYKKLSPIPTDIIPWAKKAAEHMLVTEELVPYVYIKMKDINVLRFDDNNLGEAYELSNPKALEFEMNKLGLFNVLAAISGFLPEEKVDQLVSILNNSEEYSETVIQILALRAYFINNVLMKEKYNEAALVNMGAIEAAIKYNKSVERIVRLPYASEIQTNINSFELLKDFNAAASVKLDMEAPLKNWKSIKAGAMNFYKLGQFSTEQSQVDSQKARLQANLAVIDQALQTWAAGTP